MVRNRYLRDPCPGPHHRIPRPGVERPGTFSGVIEKIPYFKALGITAIEFLPIQEFNEHETNETNPHTGGEPSQLLGVQHRIVLCP